MTVVVVIELEDERRFDGEARGDSRWAELEAAVVGCDGWRFLSELEDGLGE